MKFQKGILLFLLIFVSFFAVKAQKSQTTPTPPIVEEDCICDPSLGDIVSFSVSVLNSKGTYIKDLIYKDFDVYDKKENQEIVFFRYDELKNHYIIGIYQKDFTTDDKSPHIKVKVKLSEEKKKQFGKVFIKVKTIKFE